MATALYLDDDNEIRELTAEQMRDLKSRKVLEAQKDEEKEVEEGEDKVEEAEKGENKTNIGEPKVEEEIDDKVDIKLDGVPSPFPRPNPKPSKPPSDRPAPVRVSRKKTVYAPRTGRDKYL